MFQLRNSKVFLVFKTSLIAITARGLLLRLKMRLIEAVLAALYQHTPLEESFGINNVALVDGQPRTLGLKEILDVFLQHRYSVTRRRSEFRLRKAQERLHLVEGLLIAIADIDEVIAVIRSSEDSATAASRLMTILIFLKPKPIIFLNFDCAD